MPFKDFIAPISGLAQTAINTFNQKANQARQHRYNRELASHNFQINKTMWDLQNQYNTPKAQMQRFAEAGLNPNMIYGQGTAGNASTLPQYSQAQATQERDPIINIPEMIGLYQSVRQNNANIRKTDAEADAKEWEAEVLAGLSPGEKRGAMRGTFIKQKREGIGSLYDLTMKRELADYNQPMLQRKLEDLGASILKKQAETHNIRNYGSNMFQMLAKVLNQAGILDVVIEGAKQGTRKIRKR